MLGKLAFISYRSSPLNTEERQYCRVFSGEKCDSKTKVYRDCPVQNCTYKQCSELREALHNGGYVHDSIIFPPQVMLPPNAMLSPFDFLDLMKTIYEWMRKADLFFRYSIAERKDSYWTLLENVSSVYYSAQVNSLRLF